MLREYGRIKVTFFFRPGFPACHALSWYWSNLGCQLLFLFIFLYHIYLFICFVWTARHLLWATAEKQRWVVVPSSAPQFDFMLSCSLFTARRRMTLYAMYAVHILFIKFVTFTYVAGRVYIQLLFVVLLQLYWCKHSLTWLRSDCHCAGIWSVDVYLNRSNFYERLLKFTGF